MKTLLLVFAVAVIGTSLGYTVEKKNDRKEYVKDMLMNQLKDEMKDDLELEDLLNNDDSDDEADEMANKADGEEKNDPKPLWRRWRIRGRKILRVVVPVACIKYPHLCKGKK